MPSDLYVLGHLDFAQATAPKEAPENLGIDFPTLVPDMPPGLTVVSAAAGGRHFLMVARPDGAADDSQNVLLGFGANHFSQIDALATNTVDAVRVVQLATGGAAPVEVACGELHSLVRLADGRVLSAGDSSFGQLGQHLTGLQAGRAAETSESVGASRSRLAGQGDVFALRWGAVLLAEPATQIAAGGDLSFALGRSGALYSWGAQQSGALGHGTTGELERVRSGASVFANVVYPTKVDWFASRRVHVVGVAAGRTHVVVRSETDVYSLGDGGYGQLGHGGVDNELVPRRVAFPPGEGGAPEPLVSVAAGPRHSVCIRRNAALGGTVVYAWGNLGVVGAGETAPVRIRVGVPTDLAWVGAGPDVCCATDSEGTLYNWGRLAGGNFASGTHAVPFSWGGQPPASQRRATPQAVTSLLGKHVTAAHYGRHFIAIVADGSRWAPGPIAELATRHVTIPKAWRYKAFTGRLTADRFEHAVSQYYHRVFRGAAAAGPGGDFPLLGRAADAAAREALSQIPIAAEVPSTKIELKKRGARNLNVGSKVRVWMSDVYALGVVAALPAALEVGDEDAAAAGPGDGAAAAAFEVRWSREDWDPEMVELHSEDETLDEENDARWQSLWFLE